MNCYRDATIEVFSKMVRRLDLVYGGGSNGQMGVVLKVVHLGGCNVLGIILRTLMSKEVNSETVGEVRPIVDMSQRKA
ncbi:Probable cytokinin riboside 5'-monophosphate phosphoribohydrolase LOGL10 [Linum perenne]